MEPVQTTVNTQSLEEAARRRDLVRRTLVGKASEGLNGSPAFAAVREPSRKGFDDPTSALPPVRLAARRLAKPNAGERWLAADAVARWAA